MFEKVIKIISGVLATLVMFVLADSFYLAQKGFVWNDGKIELIKEAHAKEEEKKAVDTSGFRMDPKYVMGNKAAPVTIYEFSSLGCSHCADFHLEILPKLREEFIDSGKVKVVFADFPIDKKSMQAAMLARCMPEDKYFDFLSLLFKKQMSWGLSFKAEKLLSGYAELEGITPEAAAACMKDNNVANDIVDIRRLAMEKLDIKATPSFLVRSDDGDELITGVPNYDELKELLNKKIKD